jgi:hypothetical protein
MPLERRSLNLIEHGFDAKRDKGRGPRPRSVQKSDLGEKALSQASRVEARDRWTLQTPRTLDPFQFMLIAVAGWMNQPQQHAIEYLLGLR